MGWVKDDETYKKETTSAVPFYFYLTGISLITRAGLPPKTTLSPKDLVVTAPAPGHYVIAQCHSRKDNDATSSPEIITDGDGLAVFDT